jgi:putative DNA primase/helicase
MQYRTEKQSLRQFLSARGITITAKKPPTLRCPNPAHGGDVNPTAVLYDRQDVHMVYCPKCAESWSIFEVCGLLDNITAFPEKLKRVRESLNITHDEPEKPEALSPVALEIETARTIYTPAKLARQGREIKGSWKYLNRDGLVIALDVRYEDPAGKKEVITHWYDGETIQKKTPPVIFYNLPEALKSEKPILLSEGAKCAELSRQLEYFTPLSWSGGSGKVHKLSWFKFKNKEVFIYPDNDHPGMKAARIIKKQLPHAKIVKPCTDGEGDDIEQALKKLSLDELTAYILNTENDLPDEPPSGPLEPSRNPQTGHPPVAPDGGSSGTLSPVSPESGTLSGTQPFKILGLCEGEGHFIDEWGYYQHYKLDSLGKGRLNNIASLNFWRSEFQEGRSIQWDDAVDFIINATKQIDFDIKRLKGRGAWRAGDKICYNDGRKLYGKPDPDSIYLKLERAPIGLESEPADGELLNRVKDIIFNLSFETKTDAVRTMGWTALAPFCGALEYRPTLLMTGESGYGKTKVQTLFIQKITNFVHADMRTSSEAGIRRKISRDSKAVFFDEGGKESDKMKMNFDSILSFIRSNYSDEAPDGYKANISSEGYVTYKMSSMFGLATTDPTIENVQDENRILRVNFIKPKHTAAEWQKIESELTEILSPENCNKIRALIWKRLKTITCLTKRIVQLARDKTNRDYRSSYGDMLLASAYMVVWCDCPEPTEEQIRSMLDKYYQYQQVEENRSEVQEYVDRIMDEIIEVQLEHRREKLTVLEALSRLYYEEDPSAESSILISEKKRAYNETLKMYGIKIVDHGVHFANDSHMIQKITGLSRGYNKLLVRHPGYVKYNTPVTYSGGKSKRGTLIKGLIPERDSELYLDFVNQAKTTGIKT